MIAVQGEQVTRIDADTEEIATNVSGAQGQVVRISPGVKVLIPYPWQRAAEVLHLHLVKSLAYDEGAFPAYVFDPPVDSFLQVFGVLIAFFLLVS